MEQAFDADPFDMTQVFPHAPAVNPHAPVVQRIRDVAAQEPDRAVSKQYVQEHILQALHQMLMARMPMEMIAQKFQTSVRVVYRWKAELVNRYKRDAAAIEPGALIGEVLENYKVLISQGMQDVLAAPREGESQTYAQNRRRMGFDVTLRGQADMNRFLQLCGFFDVPHLKRAADPNDDPRTKEAADLGAMAGDFFRQLGVTAEEVEEGAIKPRAQRWSLSPGDVIVDDVPVADSLSDHPYETPDVDNSNDDPEEP